MDINWIVFPKRGCDWEAKDLGDSLVWIPSQIDPYYKQEYDKAKRVKKRAQKYTLDLFEEELKPHISKATTKTKPKSLINDFGINILRQKGDNTLLSPSKNSKKYNSEFPRNSPNINSPFKDIFDNPLKKTLRNKHIDNTSNVKIKENYVFEENVIPPIAPKGTHRIPCVFIGASYPSPKFIIYFHSNGEDIMETYKIYEFLSVNLQVKSNFRLIFRQM